MNLEVLVLNTFVDLHKKVFGSQELELPKSDVLKGFERHCRLLTVNSRNMLVGCTNMKTINPMYASEMLREGIVFRFRADSEMFKEDMRVDSYNLISAEGLNGLVTNFFLYHPESSKETSWQECYENLKKELIIHFSFLLRRELMHFDLCYQKLRDVELALSLLNADDSTKKELESKMDLFKKKHADWLKKGVIDYPFEKFLDADLTSFLVLAFLEGHPVGNFDSVEAIICG